MQYYKLGDVVEIVRLVHRDGRYGIRVGDIAKVVQVRNFEGGVQMVGCFNPKWSYGGIREMTRLQIRKVK